jgi:hypothetical protein
MIRFLGAGGLFTRPPYTFKGERSESAGFNYTLEQRRKKGCVIEEDEKGFIKLVGLEEKSA